MGMFVSGGTSSRWNQGQRGDFCNRGAMHVRLCIREIFLVSKTEWDHAYDHNIYGWNPFKTYSLKRGAQEDSPCREGGGGRMQKVSDIL